jgi:hypothetical protein
MEGEKHLRLPTCNGTVPTVCRRIADEIELWKISAAVGLGVLWR